MLVLGGYANEWEWLMGVTIVSIHLSSILHQNNRPNTSKRWLLTLFPFLFHTILGRGSPEAWQMKEATPPWTPVWSFGVRKNFGGAERQKEGRLHNWQLHKRRNTIKRTERRCDDSLWTLKAKSLMSQLNAFKNIIKNHKIGKCFISEQQPQNSSFTFFFFTII